MSDTKVDPRILRTDRLLEDALLQLIHEKPFQAITVRDITDRAGVNRSTFYEHCQDKFELMGKSIVDGWEILKEGDHRLQRQDQGVVVTELIMISLEFLKRNSKIGLIALKGLNMTPYLADLRKELIQSVIFWQRAIQPDETCPANRAYNAEFIVGGCIGVFIQWLEHGMVEPAGVVADQLTQLILQGTLGTLQKAHTENVIGGSREARAV